MNPRTRSNEGASSAADQLIFGNLNEAGTYLWNETGHLFRVPEDAVKVGRSPVIEILGKEPIVVTKLSDDPYMTITKARMTAADLDLGINF